jgi:hypothetical protein
MSKEFHFRCDICKKRTMASYNGEHWLPPKGWTEVRDPNLVKATGAHMCEECTPKKNRNAQ